MTLVEGIREALQIPRRQDSEQRIHELISGELQALAPGATVRHTGYFNHSWAPDIIVSDQEDRPVFLRFDVSDESFTLDLDALAETDPFFVDLIDATESGQHRDESPGFSVREAVSRYTDSEVLVSELDAVAALRSTVEEDSRAKKATKLVVEGGKGVVDEEAASDFSNAWRNIGEAVEANSVDTLRGALNAIEEFLSGNSAVAFENEIRTEWIAAGGEAELFPGRETWDLSDRTPDEIARLVVALVKDRGEVESARWESIARATNLSDLGHALSQTGEVLRGGKVNDFIRVAHTHWTSTSTYAPLFPAEDLANRFDWSIGGRSIGLNLARCDAFFTSAGRKWSRVDAPDELPEAFWFLDNVADGMVNGASIETPDVEVTLHLKSAENQTLRERVEEYVSEGGASWRKGRISEIEVAVPSAGTTATINYHRSVLKTAAPVPLKTMTELAAKYVAFLSEEELAEVMATLSPES